MAKRGVKIKDLARELGVPARRIIDRCREEGIWAQNSITRLPPDAAGRVREWFAAPACDEAEHSNESSRADRLDGTSPGNTPAATDNAAVERTTAAR